MRTTLFLLALIAACGRPPTLEPIDPPDPPDPPLMDESRFVAEQGAHPALRLMGELDPDLTVEVRADRLGPIFGIAGRIAFDPEHLEVLGAELAPGLLGDAVELLRVEPGSIAFGLARNGGPSAGDAELGDSARVATVRFHPRKEGDSTLRLTRVLIRRADGALVPAVPLGAEVHTVGGAR